MGLYGEVIKGESDTSQSIQEDSSTYYKVGSFNVFFMRLRKDYLRWSGLVWSGRVGSGLLMAPTREGAICSQRE